MKEPQTKGATIMWPFSQWTTAARAALIYITIGALTVIWASVWYVYLFNNPPSAESAYYYWCTGFLVTGVTMVLIGVGLSVISHLARPADLPPASVPLAVVNLQPNAAATPAPALVPLNLPAPVGAANGQVVLAPPNSLSPG
jgi:hypothetical protein